MLIPILVLCLFWNEKRETSYYSVKGRYCCGCRWYYSIIFCFNISRAFYKELTTLYYFVCTRRCSRDFLVMVYHIIIKLYYILITHDRRPIYNIKSRGQGCRADFLSLRLLQRVIGTLLDRGTRHESNPSKQYIIYLGI